jgi:hypothetical protein
MEYRHGPMSATDLMPAVGPFGAHFLGFVSISLVHMIAVEGSAGSHCITSLQLAAYVREKETIVPQATRSEGSPSRGQGHGQG